MANKAGTGRNSSKKNIKNSVILNSEETMRKMDIFGDTLFGKEKEEEKPTEKADFETTENEIITEKVEEIVPIQEEKIDDFDFEISDFSESQSTLAEEVNENNEIAQNSEEEIVTEEISTIDEEPVAQEIVENVADPSVESVDMDDILSMIDDETEEVAPVEEPIGTTDLNSDIEQNLAEIPEEETPVQEIVEENPAPVSNFSDFSSEILGNVSTTEEVNTEVPQESIPQESVPEETAPVQDGMKIEDLLIGNTLLEIMQNADVDVTAIERTEGREALKMIGE